MAKLNSTYHRDRHIYLSGRRVRKDVEGVGVRASNETFETDIVGGDKVECCGGRTECGSRTSLATNHRLTYSHSTKPNLKQVCSAAAYISDSVLRLWVKPERHREQ